jgi:hypothetical protein
LVTGHIIEPGGQAFEVLGTLSRDRNEIAHHKTRDASGMWGTEKIMEFVAQAARLDERADRAIESLEILKTEAAKFDRPFGPTGL